MRTPDDISGGNSNVNVLVVVFLAVAGIVLGIAGICVGASGKKELADLRTAVDAQTAAAGKVQSDVATLSDRIQRLGANASQEILSLRDQLTQLQAALAAREAAAKKAAEEKQRKEAAVATAGKAKADAPQGKGTYHTVVAGEIFGTIAKRYGTTTEAIEKLNPNVNPRGLRIGQKIRVK